MSLVMENNVTGLDELLAGYAAGTLAAPAQVLVDAHLELSGNNRDYVASLEALAGVGLNECLPVSLSDRDSALSTIFGLDDLAVPSSLRSKQDALNSNTSPRVPEALQSFIGSSLHDLAWKTVLPGVKEFKFDEVDGCRSNLLWVRAGRAMPSHTHDGTELTLVLQGAFRDEDGHFAVGDIAFADDEVDHKPIADTGDDCICFAVTSGNLRLTGPIGRLISPFIRN